MTPERIRQLAQQYITPGQMIYVVAGDAATQFKPLAGIGYGKPVLLK
jgi:zinc protease